MAQRRRMLALQAWEPKFESQEPTFNKIGQTVTPKMDYEVEIGGLVGLSGCQHNFRLSQRFQVKIRLEISG